MKLLAVREMGVCLAMVGALSASPAAAQLVLGIEVDPPDAGIVGIFPQETEYAGGELVTVTATPAAGFAFAGWEGDIVAAESSMTFEMTDDTSLTAVFVDAAEAGVEYALTAYVDPSGAGTIVREPADFTYVAGSEVTVTAYAADGFVFTGWSGDVPAGADPNGQSLTLVMDGDLDVLATFAAAQELVDESGAAGGTGGVAPCGSMGFVPLGLLFAMMLMSRFGRAVS